MKLLLARHGTHDEVGCVLSGRSEIALNAAGREEAARLADWLAGEAVTAIHSSPRRRALETAAPAARALGLGIVIAPALDEIDFGAFAGRTFATLDGDADWHRWNAERAVARCPGGETMLEAVARALAHIETLRNGTALLVTHCDVIRGIVAQLLGLGAGDIFGFACDPGSVTTLERRGGGYLLVALNERPRSNSSSPPPARSRAAG